MKNNRVGPWFNPIIVCAAIMMFLGCTPTSIFHKYKINDDEATSILIDAKQRAILAVTTSEHAQQGDSKKEESQELSRRVLVCAEPSPDALSVASTSLNVSGEINAPSDGTGKGQIEKILKEIAQELGSRDTTIQLLRDGLYRQCEAYLNGVIDSDEYKKLTNRYVDAMITLLAIERITPSPTNVNKPDPKPKNMKETQPSPNEKPMDKEVIDAVKSIAFAFLNNSLLDKCISEDKNGQGKESDVTNVFTDVCAFVSTSLMSKRDKQLFSNVNKLPELLKTLETTNETVGETNAALGTANNKLEQATKALETTNDTIGKTNTELTETNKTLSKTNKTTGETNAKLNHTNTALGTTNAKLTETNKALGQTNATLGTTNDKLEKADTTLGTTNDKLTKINEDLGATNDKLKQTNEALDKLKEDEETKSDGQPQESPKGASTEANDRILNSESDIE